MWSFKKKNSDRSTYVNTVRTFPQIRRLCIFLFFWHWPMSLSSAGENPKWRFLDPSVGNAVRVGVLLLLPWSKFRPRSPLVVYCAHLSLSASSGMFGLLMRNAVWEMKRRAVGVRLCMHLHWDKPCMVDVHFFLFLFFFDVQDAILLGLSEDLAVVCETGRSLQRHTDFYGCNRHL